MHHNKGMQQSRNKRAGFACEFNYGLLMQNVMSQMSPANDRADA